MNLPDTSRLKFDSKKHAYTLDGKLMSGVTTIISETSSKGALVQWAANMACDYIIDELNAAWEDREMADDPEDPKVRINFFKEVIIPEARKAHARKRDGAATKGTDTHALVEQYINTCIANGGKPLSSLLTTSDKETIDIISPFAGWAMANVERFLAAEQRLYSETHGYAGTCDFIALIDGKLTIGDLKTFPKMWSADAFIQMGAYSLAFKEMTGEQPAQSVVVKMCDPSDERLRKYGGSAFSVYPRYAMAEDEDMFLTRLKMYRYNQNFVSPKD